MSIRDFLKQPFPQLDNVQHRVILIAFTATFSVFFLNVFTPFDIDSWSGDSGVEQVARLSGFGIISGVVLAMSQLVVRRLAGVQRFRIWTFALWSMGELLLMAILFVVYHSSGRIEFFSVLKDLPESMKYTMLSILIPYSLALLFISLIIQKTKFSEMKILAERPAFETTLFDFCDEKGIVRFSISMGQILYFESADNYLLIYYLDNGKPVRQVLRNSLKNIEVFMAGSPMKRCHRSFMVNLQKIEFVDYEKASCRIKLAGLNELIPVSRKFYPEFKPYLKGAE